MTYSDKICRACLNTAEPFKYFLFDNVLPDLYLFCTSIEVYENENLPKTICDNCYDLLTKVFNFKQTCINSQNTLLECKNTVKSELDNVDDENGFEPDTIKIEENVDEFNDDDHDNSNTENAITDEDEPLLNRKRKWNIKKYNLEGIETEDFIEKSKRFRTPPIISCRLCKISFSYMERYEAHKLKHEGKKAPISCITCGTKFETWSGLVRHKKTRGNNCPKGPKSLDCRICGQTFETRPMLYRHVYKHKERQLSICDVCGKKFVSPNGLKFHLETHQENRIRKYGCDKCEKNFFTNVNLRCHISRNHRERKKFICQLCSLPFTEKDSLKRHLFRHGGLKLFKCDFCEKSFATKSYLVEHKRIHTGERPFPCTYCSKNFPSTKRLQEHLRTHTGEKPYKCRVCNQGFSQHGTMKRHTKVHDKLPTTHN